MNELMFKNRFWRQTKPINHTFSMHATLCMMWHEKMCKLHKKSAKNSDFGAKKKRKNEF